MKQPKRAKRTKTVEEPMQHALRLVARKVLLDFLQGNANDIALVQTAIQVLNLPRLAGEEA